MQWTPNLTHCLAAYTHQSRSHQCRLIPTHACCASCAPMLLASTFGRWAADGNPVCIALDDCCSQALGVSQVKVALLPSTVTAHPTKLLYDDVRVSVGFSQIHVCLSSPVGYSRTAQWCRLFECSDGHAAWLNRTMWMPCATSC